MKYLISVSINRPKLERDKDTNKIKKKKEQATKRMQ